MLVTDRRIRLVTSAARSRSDSRISLPAAGAKRSPEPAPTPTPSKKPARCDGQSDFPWSASAAASSRSAASSYLSATVSEMSLYLLETVSLMLPTLSLIWSPMAARTFGSVNKRPIFAANRTQSLVDVLEPKSGIMIPLSIVWQHQTLIGDGLQGYR